MLVKVYESKLVGTIRRKIISVELYISFIGVPLYDSLSNRNIRNLFYFDIEKQVWYGKKNKDFIKGKFLWSLCSSLIEYIQ